MSNPSKPHGAANDNAAQNAWELLTDDALSREEQALLRALAEESEEDALRMEAHAPLDASFHDRMTDRIAAQIAESARVRRQRTRRMGITATAVLAAAACALMLLRPPPVEVPEYALAMRGSVATERGASEQANVLVLTPQSIVDIRLTPATRVRSDLTLSTFLERNGKVERWPVPAESVGSGAFRIRGAASELLAARYGEWDVIFVIGLEAVNAPPAPDSTAENVTVSRARVRYEPEAAGAP